MSQPPVDLNDVQGDIILGLPKRVENFIFFTIAGNDQGAAFKRVVGSQEFSSLITSTANIQSFRQRIRDHKAKFLGKTAPLIPFAAVNIAFTRPGLNLLGLTETTGDTFFENGQLADAKTLGDSGVTSPGGFDPFWLSAFKGVIHGLILIAADCEESLKLTEERVLSLLGTTINQVFKVPARARPGCEKGHEHFGYLDGVSEPAVEGVGDKLPGQLLIKPGILLMGQDGDTNSGSRPVWAKNGSILVYRHLKQLVPEFDKFKHENSLYLPGLTIDEGAELFGARLVGRWKSGAPTDLTPLEDDPDLGADPERNNNFRFTPSDQTACPFAAHIRKTNPRADLGPEGAVAPFSIHRSGLPFGPEVTYSERVKEQTVLERGLAFVCYQSNLSRGFHFMQVSWANNPTFIQPRTGFDPIIGQNAGGTRDMGGYDPQALEKRLDLHTEFVISQGGAYLFSPSISVLKNGIGTPSG